MQYKLITKNNFSQFVSNLLKSKEVHGPKKKNVRYAFDRLETPEDLRLDYDTTILPPKKYFFPPKQDLVKFSESSFEGCIKPKELILLGVHPYDIKAISQLDNLFTSGHKDNNYMAYREATTIIGSNVQNVFKTAFFGSIGSGNVSEGFDMFLTYMSDKYFVEVATAKGEELLKYGDFTEADELLISQKNKIIEDTNKKCSYNLKYTTEQISKKVRDSFKSSLWNEIAEKCFSCGSCNLVCPTCYCFDVQDRWNIDQKSGKRYRQWDGCMMPDFATVTVQGGYENFRGEKHERYRHRIMRKVSYLNEKLGSPACVGCGRCSSACTVDIANPVNIINKIMEA